MKTDISPAGEPAKIGAGGTQAGGRPAALVSTWRLTTHLMEIVKTGEKLHPRGPNPRGLLTYTSDGRFSVINIPGERQPPKGLAPTDQEALALFKGLTAYAGRYTVSGDIVTHHVEVSWNETWSGTAQERRFKLDGDTLTIVAGPSASPWDGEVVVSTLIWSRVR
jgi:hypothetical protein